MPLADSNPMKEIVFEKNEMDPVFEDTLAGILNVWREERQSQIAFKATSNAKAVERITGVKSIYYARDKTVDK